MRKSKPIIITLIVIFVVLFFFWIIKAPLMSSYLSRKLKTNVKISKINLGFSKMTLKEFTIKNPRGNKTKNAFQTDEIIVGYSFSKLFSSPSIINDILVDKIQLNIECKNPLCSKNNWTSIMDSISAKEKKTMSQKEIVINKMTFRDLSVDIYGLGANFTKKKTTFVKEIEFNNINSKDGFPTQKLIDAIFKSTNLRDYLKGVLNPGNWMNKFNPFTIREEMEIEYEEVDVSENL